jgi:group I intron endonuclease
MSNFKKNKKYHFIYKTTNLLNGKYYIGMHSTSNLKDGYLGSGTQLRRSVRKYGQENFNLVILEWCNNREELIIRETQLIDNELLKDTMCMNIMKGGSGIDSDRAKILNLRSQISQKWLRENDEEWVNKRIKGLKETGSKIFKKLWKEGKLKNRAWVKGVPHSDETKKKISETNSIKQKGENNSQYGTQWITNGIDNKKIGKDEKIPKGWERGRKLKIII